MTYQLLEDAECGKGGVIGELLYDSAEVEYVAVQFLGKTPRHWRDFPDEVRNWSKLSPEKAGVMAVELRDAIREGKVENVLFSLDADGSDNVLLIQFANHWAAPLFFAEMLFRTAALWDPDCPGGGEAAPVRVGPWWEMEEASYVPKMCALHDLCLAAEVSDCFLRGGGLHPDLQWAVVDDNALPWEEA